jgi:hypothetical protein
MYAPAIGYFIIFLIIVLLSIVCIALLGWLLFNLCRIIIYLLYKFFKMQSNSCSPFGDNEPLFISFPTFIKTYIDEKQEEEIVEEPNKESLGNYLLNLINASKDKLSTLDDDLQKNVVSPEITSASEEASALDDLKESNNKQNQQEILFRTSLNEVFKLYNDPNIVQFKHTIHSLTNFVNCDKTLVCEKTKEEMKEDENNK